MITAGTASNQLARLVGKWRTTGKMLGGPDADKTFSGSDIYRWLPGERFLQHIWNVRMPEGRRRGVEIFGHDASGGRIFAHAYDADGSFTPSEVTFRDRQLFIRSEHLSFEGTIAANRAFISGRWSTATGATPVMDVRLVRQQSRQRSPYER